MMKERGGQLLGGLTLILLGTWFLLRSLDIDLPDLGDLWPLFPTFGGLALILTYLPRRQGDGGVLIPGCGAFLVGLFFLAITLGPLRWRDLDDWWPIFPVIGGVAFTATFAFGRKRDPGLLIPGLGGILTGAFFFLFTLGELHWSDMGRLWPAFPMIGGIAFFAAWLASRRDMGLLIPAGLGLVVGSVGFLFTLAELELEWLSRGWPIAVILIGLVIVVRSLLGRRGGQGGVEEGA